MNTRTPLTVFEPKILAGQLHDDMNFNEKVWAITMRIPMGKVTTYAAIARKLGSTAYRAVGNAMNRNPYAPQVPCHRVVGSNGALTGYAFGLSKKANLLASEGVQVIANRVDLFAFECEL